MLFQSAPFIVFLGLVVAVFWRLPAARLVVLALADAAFYLAAGRRNLILFLVASALTYAIGRRVTGPRGRAWCAIGIALNLANLVWFKYAGFIATSVAGWLPGSGLDLAWVQGILLPIGISFYTFQNISYLVDRRRAGLPEAEGYLHYWVYISFFGHSIAGPIMRGHEFLPQIAGLARLRFDGERFLRGLELFMLGLAKKLVVADNLADLVDPAFARVFTLAPGEAWVAAVLFAFQIYYDFSAYSDMAVGIGRMFGLELRQNFRTPYVSANAGEFWQRWHITLSQWIRDYVYIPLGGNRAGAARAQLNLVLAMLASGLWHGANWTFVCWGAYHGVLLLGQRAWGRLRGALGWSWLGGRVFGGVAIATFFTLTTVGWVLFRCKALDEAGWMITGMLGFHGGSFAVSSFDLALVAGLAGLHGLEYALRERRLALAGWWRERVPAVVQGLAYGGAACALMSAYAAPHDFIYFRF